RSQSGGYSDRSSGGSYRDSYDSYEAGQRAEARGIPGRPQTASRLASSAVASRVLSILC
ncbi:cold inducible RNA binding protein, partial [Homo sapiens]